MKNLLILSMLCILTGCAVYGGRSSEAVRVSKIIFTELLPLAKDSRVLMADKARQAFKDNCAGRKAPDTHAWNACSGLKQLAVYGYGQEGDNRALQFLNFMLADAQREENEASWLKPYHGTNFHWDSFNKLLYIEKGKYPWYVLLSKEETISGDFDNNKSFDEYSAYLALANIGLKEKKIDYMPYMYYHYLPKVFMDWRINNQEQKYFEEMARQFNGEQAAEGVLRFSKEIWEPVISSNKKILQNRISISDLNTNKSALYSNAIVALRKANITGAQYFEEYLSYLSVKAKLDAENSMKGGY